MSAQTFDGLRTPADDTLDYAMIGALFVSISAISLAIQAEIGSIYLSALVIGAFLATFTITPHVVAWWTDTPVDALVTPPDLR